MWNLPKPLGALAILLLFSSAPSLALENADVQGYRARAQFGDAASQVELAKYYLSEGKEKDQEKGLLYLEAAVKQKDKNAQHYLIELNKSLSSKGFFKKLANSALQKKVKQLLDSYPAAQPVSAAAGNGPQESFNLDKSILPRQPQQDQAGGGVAHFVDSFNLARKGLKTNLLPPVAACEVSSKPERPQVPEVPQAEDILVPYFRAPFKGKCPPYLGASYSLIGKPGKSQNTQLDFDLQVISKSLPEEMKCINIQLLSKLLPLLDGSYKNGSYSGDIRIEEYLGILKKVGETQNTSTMAKKQGKTLWAGCAGSIPVPIFDCTIEYHADGTVYVEYKPKLLGEGSFGIVTTKLKLGSHLTRNSASDRRAPASPASEEASAFREVAIKTAKDARAKEEILGEFEIMEKARKAGRAGALIQGKVLTNLLGTTEIELPVMDGALEFSKKSKISPKSLVDRIEVLAHAAEGVVNLHAIKVYHSDLKPGNLLVLGYGPGANRKDRETKVADFGLSVDLERWRKKHPGGNFKNESGTPGYRAPEVFFPEKTEAEFPKKRKLTIEERDERIEKRDSYSIGIMLDEVIQNGRRSKFRTKTQDCRDQKGWETANEGEGLCVDRVVRQLHKERTEQANKIEDPWLRTLEFYALEALEPDPDHRPTAEKIQKQLNAWMTNPRRPKDITPMLHAAGQE